MIRALIYAAFALLLISTFTHAQQHWQRVAVGDSLRIDQIQFADSLVGFCLGRRLVVGKFDDAVVYRTQDGGVHWQPIPVTLPKHFNFYYSQHLIVASRDVIYVDGTVTYGLTGSRDRGLTWLALDQLGDFHAFWSVSGGIDEKSTVRTTHDGGVTYQDAPAIGFNWATGGSMPPDLALDSLHWTLSTAIDSGVVTLTTDDGGQHWAKHVFFPNGYTPKRFPHNLQKGDGDTIYTWLSANIPFSILQSTNRGGSWTVADTVLANRFLSFAAPTSGNYWFVATTKGLAYYPDAYKALWTTTNAGTSWNVDSTSFDGLPLVAVQVLDAHHAWVSADSIYNPQDPFSLHRTYIYRLVQSESVKTEVAPVEAPLVCFPNPVTDLLQIPGVEGNLRRVTLIDVLGRSTEIPWSVTTRVLNLDTRGLLAGLYTALLVSNRGTSRSVRFVKH